MTFVQGPIVDHESLRDGIQRLRLLGILPHNAGNTRPFWTDEHRVHA
jgi:hypothetical protein